MRLAPNNASFHVPLIATILLFAFGCGDVRVRNLTPMRALLDQIGRPFEARRHDDLEDMVIDRESIARGDDAALKSAFERRPDVDLALVLSERHYRDARKAEATSWNRSMSLYRDAAAYASIAIQGQGPAAIRAIEVHNDSVSHLIQLSRGRHSLASGERTTDWRAHLESLGVRVIGPAPLLDPGRVVSLTPAANYHVGGLDHRYVTNGLGVPLVAYFPNDRERFPSFQDRYFSDKVETSATAVLHVGGLTEGGPWQGRTLTLELVDPFVSRTVSAGGTVLPLAADRTAALAVQFKKGRSLERAAFQAAFSSNLKRYEAGLGMLQPYRPGKIPLILVHGLISSPLTWAETINELGNDPEINDRYQIWTFLYASGEPIPIAASRLRESLRKARAEFDPSSSDSALDNMVVVGHSLGGLLAKALVQDSGLTIWDSVMNIPYPASRLSTATQAEISRSLIFQPEPYVRRVVFIATPHSGSPVAAGLLGRISLLLSKPKSDAAHIGDELDAAYGSESYSGGLRGETFSLRNLNPESRIIKGFRAIPIDPSVAHHSIALVLKHPTRHGGGDGLVPYQSTRLDSATSELIVQGNHTQFDKPEVTDELRRILRVHLQEIRESQGSRSEIR